MGRGYLTRFKLRQGKQKLTKVVKEAVTAFNNILEYEIQGVTEKEIDAAVDFLVDAKNNICDDPKLEERRRRFLRLIAEIVIDEEPTKEDEEKGEQEEVEPEEEAEQHVKTEEPNEALDYTEDDTANESLANLADYSVTAADVTFNQAVKDAASSKSEVNNSISILSVTTSPNHTIHTMDAFSTPKCLAETSVTAADMTMGQLMRELKTPQSIRHEEGSRQSQSLASLLSSARPTPLRSVHSASSHSMFADETLSRRARRSSQDLAHMLLYSDRGQMTPNTSGVLDDSVVCLGSVKKPTPPLITLEDTPRRVVRSPIHNETPKTTSEFAKARARLRRVPDSPVEKEVRRLQDLEEEESPRKSTGHRSPPLPTPAPRTRHGTPMPYCARK